MTISATANGRDRATTSSFLRRVRIRNYKSIAYCDVELGPPLCGRFFAADSAWNAPLAADAPLDPGSDQMVGALVKEIRREFDAGPQPTINTTAYSVPIYTVADAQPTVPVQLEGNEPALARSFAAVPLPDSARPAPGSDGHLVVYQPSRDRLWEFWRLRRTSGSFE